jgi:hypothetical protein
MIVTVHQPEYLPWLGFFHKAQQADLLVLLDTVQYRKDYYQNRNRIRTRQGWTWLTVPVCKQPHATLIRDVRIHNGDKKWKRKLWSLVSENYRRAPYFETYAPALHALHEQTWELLAPFNIPLIRLLLSLLGVDVKIVVSSGLDLPPVAGGTAVNLSICEALGASEYISGISGRDYLDEQAFREKNIRVLYQEFYHPIYRQLYEPFVPCLSVIDLLFNHGEKSLNIIRGEGVECMKELFV